MSHSSALKTSSLPSDVAALAGFKSTDVGLIPEDWRLLTLKNVAARTANAIVGGPFGSDLVSADYTESGIPVIRGQNMTHGVVSGEFAFVSHAKAKALAANTATKNDLIFTQRGTLGQVCLVEDHYPRYLISQSQMKITLDAAQAHHIYVCHYFLSSFGQRQILDSAIQTGVPHTNLGIL